MPWSWRCPTRQRPTQIKDEHLALTGASEAKLQAISPKRGVTDLERAPTLPFTGLSDPVASRSRYHHYGTRGLPPYHTSLLPHVATRNDGAHRHFPSPPLALEHTECSQQFLPPCEQLLQSLPLLQAAALGAVPQRLEHLGVWVKDAPVRNKGARGEERATAAVWELSGGLPPRHQSDGAVLLKLCLCVKGARGSRTQHPPATCRAGTPPHPATPPPAAPP